MDHFITGLDEKFLPVELEERGRELVSTAITVLNGYMRYLKRSKPENE